MDTLIPCAGGLDVHKKFVMACIRKTDPQTGQVREEVKRFGTMTGDLLALGDWMAAAGVTDVAMESTGVYWKPVWNLLEGRFQLLLANPRELKQVPGRKSDVRDCQWIAHLLACGLLTASFVPSQPQRDLRDLTRYRACLMDEHTRVANRIQKVLEDANIKLASVASDVLGMSVRVDSAIARPSPPQIRTCGFPASGSSVSHVSIRQGSGRRRCPRHTRRPLPKHASRRTTPCQSDLQTQSCTIFGAGKGNFAFKRQKDFQFSLRPPRRFSQ